MSYQILKSKFLIIIHFQTPQEARLKTFKKEKFDLFSNFEINPFVPRVEGNQSSFCFVCVYVRLCVCM